MQTPSTAQCMQMYLGYAITQLYIDYYAWDYTGNTVYPDAQNGDVYPNPYGYINALYIGFNCKLHVAEVLLLGLQCYCWERRIRVVMRRHMYPSRPVSLARPRSHPPHQRGDVRRKLVRTSSEGGAM